MATYSLTAFSLLAAFAAVTFGQTNCGWDPEFGQPGVYGPVGGDVVDAIVFDDGLGGGPAVYACGTLHTDQDGSFHHIGKWDGTKWSGVGGGIDYSTYALAVFDDGTGPALYAGGNFDLAGGVAAEFIAKWDGRAWSPVGLGIVGVVEAMAVFDDGSGPALYVGGWLSEAGGVPCSNIARWDGTTWTALGGGVDGPVYTLLEFAEPGENRPSLFAGGNFDAAGASPAGNIARWDGTSWSQLGLGTNSAIRHLAAFDDGRGPALYAGGFFTEAGGVPASRVARWDGSVWTALGAGVDGVPPEASLPSVQALRVFDDGKGPQLYVGGYFANAGGQFTGCIARWDGSGWSGVGIGAHDHCNALLASSVGGSEALLAFGGFYEVAGELGTHRAVQFDSDGWSEVGHGLAGDSAGVTVYSLLATESDGAPVLYACGRFLFAGDALAPSIASWNGERWSTVGGAISGDVYALAEFQGDLIAGGDFISFGDSIAFSIATWDGSRWSALGEGLADTDGVRILSLIEFDDGSGPALYAGGQFEVWLPGGIAHSLARWDGRQWSTVGDGYFGEARDMAIFDDGNGPALYVARPQGLWRWNGTEWSSVVESPSGGEALYLTELEVYDDGKGSALFVAGDFQSIGGIAANRIAKWDGRAWSALAGGLNDYAFAMQATDDAAELGLHVGGVFTVAGDVTANGIARWDGRQWHALGTGIGLSAEGAAVSNGVFALADFASASSAASLVMGGRFDSVDGQPANRIAQWTCASAADLDGDGAVGSADVGLLLSAWGSCEVPADCAADLNGDGSVDGLDLALLLGQVG